MTRGFRKGYTGSGPGDFTPDGCAVDLYSRLPARGEPEIIAAAAPPPATLLELGCGAGRVTHPLLSLGYAVTAVDESPEMLDRIRGARTIRSSIEELDLGETFDVVLLGSFLIHAPHPVGDALLATCRRHAAPGGVVLIQHEGPDWHKNVPRESPLGDGVARALSSTDQGDGTRLIRFEYAFPDATWTQEFRSRPLSAAQFEETLNRAGLRLDRRLTEDDTWAAAVPT
ncbi:class I SAM-dependent methyltransferase [Actinoplanes sp. NBRC 101535]|uniref:class I SAM-dependent methyltransferase n=1 Tax=Actinoplanes sp. NBRC 101535 TaxID=3032196 RepID=UPI0024A3E57D|nr:class I SAM-dependent methyltransferase [Actinoplanes sp. NBRC 101535]GLY07539.1 methyltransferase [Actinoplanes sp. NBRC 101535]